MPTLNRRKREALCQALARGLGPRDAMDAAGYSSENRDRRRTIDNPKVVERVAEILREGAALTLVIRALWSMADEARPQEGLGGLREARLILTEVARLKARLSPPFPLSPPPAPPRPMRELTRELTHEEWRATHDLPAL